MLLSSEYVSALRKWMEADAGIVILLCVANRHIESVGADVFQHTVVSENTVLNPLIFLNLTSIIWTSRWQIRASCCP